MHFISDSFRFLGRHRTITFTFSPVFILLRTFSTIFLNIYDVTCFFIVLLYVNDVLLFLRMPKIVQFCIETLIHKKISIVCILLIDTFFDMWFSFYYVKILFKRISWCYTRLMEAIPCTDMGDMLFLYSKSQSNCQECIDKFIYNICNKQQNNKKRIRIETVYLVTYILCIFCSYFMKIAWSHTTQNFCLYVKYISTSLPNRFK